VKIVAQRHLRGDHLPRRDFRATSEHGFELERHVRRRDIFASYDLRASRPPATSAARSSLSSIISHRVRQLPAAPPSGPSSSARLPRAISSASATSSAARPLPPTTCAPADHLQHQRLAHLVIHNILHRVRHLPGGLESPAAAPPLRGACRRLHASGTRKHPKLTASQASEPPTSALCHDNPTPLPCVTSSRVHRLLLLCV
jgi:hypothetical protein